MRTWISLWIVGMLLTACQKDNDETAPKPEPEPETQTVYMPLKHGSYWIYDHYKMDTTGEETHLDHMRDSLVIQRDSIVNGISYAVLEGKTMLSNWHILHLLRDSADCVVNLKGIPLFASNNYTSILHEDVLVNLQFNDTIFTVYYQMRDTPATVTVPAGNFEVINNTGTFTIYQDGSPDPDNQKESRQLYAAEIGLVLDTYLYLNAPFIHERRLVRYHIAED